MTENRRSREAVRNSIRTYGVKVMDPASLPLKTIRESESTGNVSRYSERSLHSQYQRRKGCRGKCLSRIPYATLIASIICGVGLITFTTAMERCSVLSSNLLNTLLKRDSPVINVSNQIFLMEVVATAVIGVMILVIGILATGDTRARVYGQWKSRIGGRICCATLMGIALFTFTFWQITFFFTASLSFVVYTGSQQCSHLPENIDTNNCLHLPELNILFPDLKEEVVVCDMQEVKKFCKDYIEKVTLAYFMVDLGVLLIIFSMVLYLICLSANYARIRCQSKFQELEELNHLQSDHNVANKVKPPQKAV